MSKSRGNVINPDDVVRAHGADTLRLYEMFMGPFDQAIPWDTKGVIGVKRFLDKVFTIYNSDIEVTSDIDNKVEVLFNKTIAKVSSDIESMGFNTAVSALMILANKILEVKKMSPEIRDKFLILLSPFAPHIAEELWSNLGHKKSISLAEWPKADKSKLRDELVDIVVQINGKMRAKLKLSPDISEAEAVKLAMADDNVKKYLAGQSIKKTIFVPGRLLSFVV